jgi:hypothetical protein
MKSSVRLQLSASGRQTASSARWFVKSGWTKKVYVTRSMRGNYRQIADARSSANFSLLESHAAEASVKQLMRGVIAQWSFKSVFLLLSFAFHRILRALNLFDLILLKQ